MIIRRQRERRFQFALGFLVRTHHEVRLAHHVVRGRTTRIACERTTQRLCGLLILRGMEIGDGQLDERSGGLIPVRRGSLKCCDCPTVVGLCHVDFPQRRISRIQYGDVLQPPPPSNCRLAGAPQPLRSVFEMNRQEFGRVQAGAAAEGKSQGKYIANVTTSLDSVKGERRAE